VSITALLTLLLVVIVLGIIFWAGQQLLARVPMDPIFRVIAIAIFAIICVIIVFYYVLLPLLHAVPTG
jgi:hypothetical protein